MRKLLITLVFLLFYINSNSQTESYSLSEYLKNKKINYLITVTHNKDTLTLYGYKKGEELPTTIKIKLEKHEGLRVNEWSSVFKKGHFNPLPISITSIPFKIRPTIDEFKTNANSGITNIGFNFDLGHWKTEKYFYSGGKSTHKFNIGIWIAPTVEELNTIHTRGFLTVGTKSKQLFISSALTFNYTYNKLTFTFTPIGFDFATSLIGKEWVYNKKRWWGFGIGLEPKFLNKINN